MHDVPQRAFCEGASHTRPPKNGVLYARQASESVLRGGAAYKTIQKQVSYGDPPRRSAGGLSLQRPVRSPEGLRGGLTSPHQSVCPLSEMQRNVFYGVLQVSHETSCYHYQQISTETPSGRFSNLSRQVWLRASQVKAACSPATDTSSGSAGSSTRITQDVFTGPLPVKE